MWQGFVYVYCFGKTKTINTRLNVLENTVKNRIYMTTNMASRQTDIYAFDRRLGLVYLLKQTNNNNNNSNKKPLLHNKYPFQPPLPLLYSS